MTESKYPKEKKLISITQYAEKYELNRHTVYRLLEEGKLTRYIGLDGDPMVDPDEEPKDVRAYKERPEFPSTKDDENDTV